jgi:hypothetical protein
MRIDEISSALLAKYKKEAGKAASEADKRGEFEKGHKRFKGIVRATKKEFEKDAEKRK